MVVRMELSRILIRELNDYQIIELREVQPTDAKNGDGPSSHGLDPGAEAENGHSRSFPIVIGLPEAQAIERRLKGIPIKRPQTHDLLMSLVESLGGRLESIAISDLREHTFYAILNVRDSHGKLLKIDSRPSDAIALGVANNLPIYVEEKVLDAAQNDE